LGNLEALRAAILQEATAANSPQVLFCAFYKPTVEGTNPILLPSAMAGARRLVTS
jgi:hypothetical protein